jgi:DnaK suppressor protein
MNKQLIERNKKALEKEKENLQEMLQGFAKENKDSSSDWDTKFPDFRAKGVLDEEADEVEEYSSLLPIEKTLETKLQRVEKALDKIEKNTYGRCELCDKEIEEKRLDLVPETSVCGQCKK